MYRFRNFLKAVLDVDLTPRCFSTVNKKPSELHTLIMDMKKDLKPSRPKQKSKYAAANVTLQVLGSGAKGSPASLYVFSDQSRYLFNCGEGTQRLAHEHKMKLSKLEHVFITHSSWKNFGGLPGMCLTLQDSGVSEVVLHGPPQVDDIFWATKRFVVLRDLTVHKADQSTPFEDTVMRVEYVVLESSDAIISSEQQDEQSETADLADNSETDDNSNTETGKRKNEAKVESSSKRVCYLSPGRRQSVCYICRLHPKPGTLQLDKCEAHGVPLGPLLGRLKAGNDVTLPSGKIVHSSDVTSPDEPGPVFIVVDCPDASYLPAMLASTQLTSHQSREVESEEHVAAAVVHFSPLEVVRLPEYQEWIDKFPPSTAHLVLNEGNQCQGTTAVHRIQHKLHLLHPTIFPLLANPKLSVNNIHPAAQGDTLFKFQLRPRKGLDKSCALVIDPEEYVKETMNEIGFPEELEKLKETLKSYNANLDMYPRLTFLGTGSCIPNKTRNTSGILLEIESDKLVLVDCGEGTLGQIQRLLGSEGSDHALCSLQAVFISHLHADHHIGLVGILKARNDALQRLQPGQDHPPLLLIAPHQIMPWLNIYNQKYESISELFRLLPLLKLTEGEGCADVEARLGLSSFRTVFVKHCPNAFGVAFQHQSGWKLVYSGDTEPCPQLIEIGQDCDLLVHEATMEDGLEEEARKKKHSTTSEAIEVGQKMKAKFTLLTHFSQRYSKIPLFNDKFSETVGIAFDNMQVSLSQLPLLPLLYPSFRVMFNKYYEEMEQKTRHHQLRQERRAKAATSAQ